MVRPVSLLAVLVLVPVAGALPVTLLPGHLVEAWSAWYDGGSTDQVFDLAFTPDGGVVAVGSTYIDSVVGHVSLVTKLAPDGGREWTLVGSGGGDRVTVLPGGAIVAAQGSCCPDEVSFHAYDAAGALQWSHAGPAKFPGILDLAAHEDGTTFALTIRRDGMAELLRFDPGGAVLTHAPMPFGLRTSRMAVDAAGLTVAASNAFNIYLWRLDHAGGVQASRVIPSSAAVGGVAAIGGLAVVASDPTFAVDASLATAWTTPLAAGDVAAAGERIALLGQVPATLRPDGSICAVSERVLQRTTLPLLLFSNLYGMLPGEEDLRSVAAAPDGRMAVAGLRWSGDGSFGATGYYDALTAVLREDPGCGGLP